MSTLGYGFQAAKPLTPRSDVRSEFNFYRYNRDFSKDGANYSGSLRLRSVTGTWFPRDTSHTRSTWESCSRDLRGQRFP
ncbi:MAG TPA: hypothetical protein VK210_08955 [Terriglobia bacterium]|nr:hypothetical protein [Terriglobia bacterium]